MHLCICSEKHWSQWDLTCVKHPRASTKVDGAGMNFVLIFRSPDYSNYYTIMDNHLGNFSQNNASQGSGGGGGGGGLQVNKIF